MFRHHASASYNSLSNRKKLLSFKYYFIHLYVLFINEIPVETNHGLLVSHIKQYDLIVSDIKDFFIESD